MASCQDMERLLTPYIDGEAAPDERHEVEGHLQRCRPCADSAAAERVGRRVLQVRAQALSVRAPEHLRVRCAALGRRPGRSSLAWLWTGWRAVGLSAASAAAVLVGAVLVYGMATHSPTVLAAELTLDHVKCFAFFQPPGGAPADPGRVSSQLQAAYGWRIAVPASAADRKLTLLGARRCFSTDGSVAHVLYRHAGHPLSLFVFPAAARAAAQIAMAGHVARIWSKGTMTYVLLGSTQDRDLQPVAAYFASSAF